MTEGIQARVKKLRNRAHRLGRNLLHNRFWVRFGGVTYIRVTEPSLRLRLQDSGMQRRDARLYIRMSKLILRTIPLSDTAISIPHLGMFGNAMAAFMPVFARAHLNQVGHVIVHHESVLSSSDEFGKKGHFQLNSGLNIWLDFEPTRRNNKIAALIGDKTLVGAIDEESGTRAWTEASALLLGDEPGECTPESTLVIHLRGGDVYGGNRHLLNHGQPPLSYYELILDHGRWQRVLIVHQGKNMPTLEPLLAACEQRGLTTETQSGSLWADLTTLLKATTIVAGRGSFVPQIVGLSRCVKNVYTFESGYGLAIPKKGLTVHRVLDSLGEYRGAVLNKNWTNRPEQRQLQVEYPTSALRFDKQEP